MTIKRASPGAASSVRRWYPNSGAPIDSARRCIPVLCAASSGSSVKTAVPEHSPPVSSATRQATAAVSAGKTIGMSIVPATATITGGSARSQPAASCAARARRTSASVSARTPIARSSARLVCCAVARRSPCTSTNSASMPYARASASRSSREPDVGGGTARVIDMLLSCPAGAEPTLWLAVTRRAAASGGSFRRRRRSRRPPSMRRGRGWCRPAAPTASRPRIRAA